MPLVEQKQSRTLVGVILILVFGALMCCGATLVLGAVAGYDDAKKQASTPPPADDDTTDVPDDDPIGEKDTSATLKEQFADEMLAGLADAGHPDYVYDADRYELSVPDGGARLLLGNLFDEYARVEVDQREAFIERAVRSTFPADIPEDWASAAPNLKLTVRDRVFLEMIRVRTPNAHMLSRPLGEELVELVAFDGPDAMSYVNDETAAKWGKSLDDVFAKARQNLAADSTERFTAVSPGVWESPWSDNYDTGRAALFDVIRKLKVKGDPVLFLPQRDHLIVTGSNDARGLDAAIDLVDERLDLPRSNTGRGWRLTASGLVPWEPPAESRAWFLRKDATRNDYNEQKGALDEKFDADGTDLFVATVLEVEDDEEGVHHYCVWTKDAESLLPKTEYVVFVDLDQPEGRRVVAAAKWEDVMSRLGSAVTEEPDYWPQRHHVKTFPDAKTLRALGTVPWFVRNREE